jgi:putative hydrolase of the HAD superfamily
VTLSGILFDLDGTLADTASAERDAWPSLAAVIERHAPMVDVDDLHGRYHQAFERHWTAFVDGEIDFAEYRRRRLGEALEPWCEVTDELFEAYRAEKRRGVERLRLFDDAVPTLRTLRASGLRVGLLTNGPSTLQRHKLEVTRLEPELDAIAISEEIDAWKPGGDAFHRAAELLGCSPAETAMVGDSPVYDIEGALAAGLGLAVLVGRDVDLELEGTAVVPALADVPALLGAAGAG